ncbi:MAG: transketolase [Planctomycetota bacterium]
MARWNWEPESLCQEYLAWHETARSECLRDIVQMTHQAQSGHPGGSLSSLDFYLVLYAHAAIDPQEPWAEGRDRIVVSHGHTSPGVYSVLAKLGFFPRLEVVTHFRRTTHVFEGHIEREVPGVEWTTGNLGQGFSAACGMALAERIKGIPCQVYVPMGDGEQQKGQISEARRFAVKYKFNNITVIIDRNHQQIGGNTRLMMPQNVAECWKADGWQVTRIDGHDPEAIYQALRTAVRDTQHPHAILADTVMGKGVSFMEGKADFHGRATKPEEYARAAAECGGDPASWDLQALEERVASPPPPSTPKLPNRYTEIVPGTPRTYAVAEKIDNRSAFGNALVDVAEANRRGSYLPIAVFDCDLEGSVKTGAFHKAFPENFFEAGIQEHHTAATAGALSVEGIATIFADFGVFGIAETYNQHRLTDINHGHLKLVCTHIGLDVGEDGKTHQCIDYVGVLHNLFGMNVIVPADPNQTDRALRYMMVQPGMFFLGMGRSKVPVISDDQGAPCFGDDYQFEVGRVDWIRRGTGVLVVVMGTLTGRALTAVESLRSEGLEIALAHLATPLSIQDASLEELTGFHTLVTVEDHSIRTGLGACLARELFAKGHTMPHLRLGVERYCPSGSAEAVFASQNLHAKGIERRIAEFVRAH